MGILNVLWGLLNLGLFASLLGGLFSGFRSLRNRFGILGVILPFIVLAGMFYNASNKSQTKRTIESFRDTVVQQTLAVDLLPRHPYYVILEDLKTLAINQLILLSQIDQSDSLQIQSSSYLTGFTSGIIWSTIHTHVNVQSKQRLQYRTAGTLEWQLLGFTLFKQAKQFDGYVDI